MSPKLIDGLESLRRAFGGKPVVVNSGYRCPRRNVAVRGALNSQHVLGNAADVFISGVEPLEVAHVASEISEFRGIGVSPVPPFIHLDVRQGPRAAWAYKSDGTRIPTKDHALLAWQQKK